MNSVTADIIALFIAAVVPPVGVYYVTRGILGMLGKIGAPIDNGLKKMSKAGQEKAMQGRIGEFAEDQKRRKEVRRFQGRAGNGALSQWGRDEKRSGTLRGRAATWLGTRQKAFDERYGSAVGGTRGAALATQGIHKAFDEDVSAYKTTMSDKTNDELLEMMEDTSLSEEQRAAAAGLVMSRSHRGSHIKALRIAGKQMRNGDAKEKSIMSSVQKQMASDMKARPWALGDEESGKLLTGQYSGDIDDAVRSRAGGKLSASGLANMDPDEMKMVHSAAMKKAGEGGLTDEQAANVVQKIREARNNPQLNDLIKPEAAKLHDEILARHGHLVPELNTATPVVANGAPNATPGNDDYQI